MLVVDILIVGITVAIAVQGWKKGVTATGLIALGFAVGALIGSRVPPLVLEGGLHDDLAPVVALPAAVLLGALGATAMERLSLKVLHRVRNRYTLDGLGGAALAAVLCLVVVWLVGAVAGSFDGLKSSVRDIRVVEGLNAVLPPPGPLLKSEERRSEFPLLAGPTPGVAAADAAIKNDPQIKAAGQSVVKVSGTACGHGGTGSGWVARNGIVVTNAHVVEGSNDTRVQVGGVGPLHDAEPIWYDDVNDIAILRVPGVRGVPRLAMDLNPRPGTAAAALGFPGGGPYTVRPARLGNTWRRPGFRLKGRKFNSVPVTSFLAVVRPGNSGGPVVDGHRRVVTMVFGGRQGGHGSYGVPVERIDRALSRAGPPVDTGLCPE